MLRRDARVSLTALQRQTESHLLQYGIMAAGGPEVAVFQQEHSLPEWPGVRFRTEQVCILAQDLQCAAYQRNPCFLTGLDAEGHQVEGDHSGKRLRHEGQSHIAGFGDLLRSGVLGSDAWTMERGPASQEKFLSMRIVGLCLRFPGEEVERTQNAHHPYNWCPDRPCRHAPR